MGAKMKRQSVCARERSFWNRLNTKENRNSAYRSTNALKAHFVGSLVNRGFALFLRFVV